MLLANIIALTASMRIRFGSPVNDWVNPLEYCLFLTVGN